MTIKLTAVLAAARFFGLGNTVDAFEAAMADGHLTLAEDLSIAEQFGAWLAKQMPGKAELISAVTLTLGDIEAAVEKIEPDVERVIALVKAEGGGNA